MKNSEKLYSTPIIICLAIITFFIICYSYYYQINDIGISKQVKIKNFSRTDDSLKIDSLEIKLYSLQSINGSNEVLIDNYRRYIKDSFIWSKIEANCE